MSLIFKMAYMTPPGSLANVIKRLTIKRLSAFFYDKAKVSVFVYSYP